MKNEYNIEAVISDLRIRMMDPKVITDHKGCTTVYFEPKMMVDFDIAQSIAKENGITAKLTTCYSETNNKLGFTVVEFVKSL